MKPLAGALKIQRIAAQVVELAVHVERGQGDGWTEIGRRIGITRSAASKRWQKLGYNPKSLEKTKDRFLRDLEWLHLVTGDLLQDLRDEETKAEDIRDVRSRMDELEERVARLEERCR